MNKISTMHAAAKWYAQNNFKVFPLRVKSKLPLTNDGFKSATTDISKINEWWEKWPMANIGIATGKSLVVIDVDHSREMTAIDTLIEFENEFGSLPETPHVLTGGGGYQFYFRTDAEICSRIGVRSKVDIKANGGYVVAPPSIHPNGKKYEWEALHRICDIKVAKLPEPVQKFLLIGTSNSPEKKSDSHWENLLTNQVLEGSRNHSIASVAGHLLRRHVSLPLARAMILSLNQTAFIPPLPKLEVEKILESISVSESRRRSQIGATNGK